MDAIAMAPATSLTASHGLKFARRSSLLSSTSPAFASPCWISAPARVCASLPNRVVSNALTALERHAAASDVASPRNPPATNTSALVDEVRKTIAEMGHDDTNLLSTNEHRAWVAVTSGALLALLARGVAGAIGDESVTSIIATCASAAFAYVLADFGTGAYHFGVDNYGDANTPVFGGQIDAFQGHHRRPWTITKRQFANNLHALAKPTLVATLPFLLVLPHSAPSDAFWSVFLACAMYSQQFHAWSHMPRSQLPPLVVSLQDAGLLVSRKMHGAHHRPPYNVNYCIVSGICNGPLDSYGFFTKLERFIFSATGTPPRSWSETAPEWLEEGGYYEDGSDE